MYYKLCTWTNATVYNHFSEFQNVADVIAYHVTTGVSSNYKHSWLSRPRKTNLVNSSNKSISWLNNVLLHQHDSTHR